MEDISLDLWCGEHYIRKDTYYLNRPYGLFSNITVMMYGIISFSLRSRTPHNLSMTLIEYDYNIDFYPLLFTIKDNFKISNIPQNEINLFTSYIPTYLGLGMCKCNLFNIFDSLNDSYFQINDTVKSIMEDIKTVYNIDYENTVFIWARKTDKITEISIPDVEDYIKLYKSLSIDKRVIIQTDDPDVYDEFIEKGYECLNYIPLSSKNRGFHIQLRNINDDDFNKLYNITKTQYLQRLLALVNVASKCNTVIIYPGCLSTYIPIIRGNWNNVYSFKNKNELI